MPDTRRLLSLLLLLIGSIGFVRPKVVRTHVCYIRILDFCLGNARK